MNSNNNNTTEKSEAIATGTVSEDEMDAEAVDDAGFLSHKARTRSQSHELVLLHSITTTTTTSSSTESENTGGGRGHRPQVVVQHQYQEQDERGGGGVLVGETSTKTWQQTTPNHDLSHSIRGGSKSDDLKASIEQPQNNEDDDQLMIVYDTRC